MAAVDAFPFLNLPQELQDRIVFFAIEDVLNQTTGPIELKISGGPWKTAIYPYSSIKAGRFRRLTSSSTPDRPTVGVETTRQTAHNDAPALTSFGLLYLCRHTHFTMQMPNNFWKAVSRRLVFSDTAAMTRLAPLFSPFLKEVTILKRFQAGQYLSVNNSKPHGRMDGSNSTCVFRSIEALKSCPSLERINIYLSIPNCECQISIAESLLPARQILGTQATIHVEVKHCARCQWHSDAFGVPEEPFAHTSPGWNDNGIHILPDKVYWKWQCPAGSVQWEPLTYLTG
ncbi:hypothetical protein H2200_010482 [Cladophialophora chaetospira]|uniref:Uncharacterized protein n=1 Tax=Cladophialophora chaetospira TaxID=386627 RepID=A0AA39CEC8_9EURO|nr:hypothetical protein H2200_010482 [Cladophialophora chaetospira]